MAPSAAIVEASPVATEPTTAPGWDLDIRLIEQADPAKVVTMTDDNCGNTCEGSTCISAV